MLAVVAGAILAVGLSACNDESKAGERLESNAHRDVAAGFVSCPSPPYRSTDWPPCSTTKAGAAGPLSGSHN